MNRYQKIQKIKKILGKVNENQILDTEKNTQYFGKKINEKSIDLKSPSHCMPFIEKYRPRTLEKIVGQTNTINILKESMAKGNLPHVLFYGPPGTGKTTTALALARELFGPKIFAERVMELNASDDRGINTVRVTIKNFARQTIGRVDKDYKCPPIKLIILDEADAMTGDAQNALRKVIEDTSAITRFIFICNYKHLIIEPIQSRCAQFYFPPLTMTQSIDRIQLIAKKEKIDINEEIIKRVIEVTDGDLRRAIMMLQNVKYSVMTNMGAKITVDDIDLLRGAVPFRKINKKFNKLKDLDSVLSLANFIKDSGYSVNTTIDSAAKYVIQNSERYTDQQKSKILFIIADIEKRLLEGANEYLQMVVVLIALTDN